ncbi:MAG TPA: diguanylate cyclase [Solirubrobacteraceae bacterium]|jgi:diguanylate cyclase (GGDEF)-like protein|nr:diguanylate cyclase [Solirubrobacteraceae bacterium]
MASSHATDLDIAGSDDARQARLRLDRARGLYYEDPAGALADAIRCCEIGRSLRDEVLCARAFALQGMISLHRGDLRGGLTLAMEAERHPQASNDAVARAEVAALKAQISFFTGSYAEALRHAQLAVDHADAAQDLELRVYARRATCPVFGNVEAPDLRERIEELLALAIEIGSPWEEAISRNDLACYRQQQGELDEAASELGRALAAARRVDGANSFALAVIHSTRADIRLLQGRAEDALADAERSIELLSATDDPNPYILGATVRADVEARMALGQLDDALETGEGALSWLGDRVPQTRSLILSTLASTLRAAGRLEQAYDALARSAELERQAFRELSELQLRLERATLEASAARQTSTALAAKNRQLADAHSELECRAGELEVLQGQLREQAERDWLTGLHNRRYFARELERLATEQRGDWFSLAIIDLDHFKSINDRFGHEIGDHVLVRVAALLCEVLRQQDVVVRSGGEEFLVLMPGTEVNAAAACCERIRQRLRGEPWEQVVAGLTVTASVGVASTDDPDQLAALTRSADQRLYEAKRSGRDRVVNGARACR